MGRGGDLIFINARLNEPPAATPMVPSLLFLFHFHHSRITKSGGLGAGGSGGWVLGCSPPLSFTRGHLLLYMTIQATCDKVSPLSELSFDRAKGTKG